MKFDKFMEHCYKIMCIVVACVVTFGSVVSCFSKPLKASAVDPFDIKETLLHYSNAFKNNMQVVLSAYQHDVNSGTLDGTSSIGQQILKQVMLQYLNQMTVDGVFPAGSDYWEIDWENIPNTIDFSGSGSSGFYRSSIDNKIHIVTLGEEFDSVLSQNLTANMIFSDEFNIDYNFRAVDDSLGAMSFYADYFDSNGPSMGVHVTHTPHETYRFYKTANDSFNLITFSNGGQVTVTLRSSNSYSHNTGFGISHSSTIPTFNYNVTLSSNSTYSMIGACGIDYSLPDGEAPSISPWDYYNNVLLPQLIQFFNDNHIENYDKYLVFPDGYSPPLQPDPTEAGTMPSGGISIGSNNNIDIDINVYYPTDESGQPVTDESGETVTETYFVTDTTPTDVVYKFTIPTLPNLDRYSDTLPPMNLAQFESGINFIFSAADGIFTDTGFLPVIIVTLSLCALCYVIWKIGG